MPPGKLQATRREDEPRGDIVARPRPGRQPGEPEGGGDMSGELMAAALGAMAPFYIVDPGGRIAYANPAYVELAQTLLGPAANPLDLPLLVPFSDIVADLGAVGAAS